MNGSKRFITNHKRYFSLKVQRFSSLPKDLTEEGVNSKKKKKICFSISNVIFQFSQPGNLLFFTEICTVVTTETLEID